MKKTVISLVAVVAVIAAGLFYYSPAFRTNAITAAESIGQWTPEAIEKNKIGYTQFVETKLKKDLKTFQDVRKALTRQMEVNSKLLAEKTKLLQEGRKLLDQFAEATLSGEFPAELHGKTYTETQLKNQIALTKAQVEGIERSIAGIQKASQVAEQEICKRIVGIEDMESQLQMMSTEREIFRSQSTSDVGFAMLAEARAVLEGNQLLVKENPVRTIQEILKASEVATSGNRASDTEVEAFLADYKSKKLAKSGKKLVQTEEVPAAPGD